MFAISDICMNKIDVLCAIECALWTSWDQQKVSRIFRCPNFPSHFI